MAEPILSHVSDTARWTAYYRALESARPDALFKDPFAERLAGEQGKAIAAKAPAQVRNGWPTITRTRLFDDLIAASLASKCDVVIDLAAGLDARPYRLGSLTPDVHWIEADLPGIIDEKERLLAGEKPKCRLTREKVDLGDAAARSAFLDKALAEAKKALVITEGLTVYLDEEVVRGLARDLAARPAIRWWIVDVGGPAILKYMQKGMGEQMAATPFKFAPANGVAFYEAEGWKARDVWSVFRSAIHFRRAPWLMWPFVIFPDPDPRKPGNAKWSAVVRFEPAMKT